MLHPLRELPRSWNARAEERVRHCPCDALLAEPFERWARAVSVAAAPGLLYRWLCQLRVAPYSYDWIDNLGRRSPRRLTPGLDALAEGQRFLVFTIVSFTPGRQITGVATAAARRLFGDMAITYASEPEGNGARLVARLDVAARSRPARVRRELLAWGDLVMMRKQLLTLKALAERDARRAPAS